MPRRVISERDLLGVTTVKVEGEKEQERQRKLSDNDADLIPVKGEGGGRKIK